MAGVLAIVVVILKRPAAIGRGRLDLYGHPRSSHLFRIYRTCTTLSSISNLGCCTVDRTKVARLKHHHQSHLRKDCRGLASHHHQTHRLFVPRPAIRHWEWWGSLDRTSCSFHRQRKLPPLSAGAKAPLPTQQIACVGNCWIKSWWLTKRTVCCSFLPSLHESE